MLFGGPKKGPFRTLNPNSAAEIHDRLRHGGEMPGGILLRLLQGVEWKKGNVRV